MTLEEAVLDMLEAEREFAVALTQLQAARSRETACLNRLNNAQADLGALIDAMKKDAPSQSDWGRK